MDRYQRNFPPHLWLPVLLIFAALTPVHSQTSPKAGADMSLRSALPWQTPARWRRGLFRKTPGVLSITGSGISFQPVHGLQLHWPFQEIRTFDLAPRSLVLTGYQNRPWHLHGDRKFRFVIASPVPPAVAAGLAARVGKPSENGLASRSAPTVAEIAARHRTLGGGTNGILRLRETGMDYVTRSGKGERSWRWADIETLTLTDPYHLSVGAYRGTFALELKQQMNRQLFDWLWNKVYGRNLSGMNPERGTTR